ETADGKTHRLDAVKAEEFPDYKDIMTEAMSLKIRQEVAILRIPSFAESYLQEHQQKFKKEIKQYMERLQGPKVKKLLIDLRGNTGGTDSHAAFLSSFFFDKAYRYWNYIEVTEAIAQELKGGKRVFYGKPIYKDGRWLWSDKGLYGKEFSFTRIQKGSEQAFMGSVYILTDGLCMSSCADFVAIMQFNQKAQIIGEETGGGYMGNTSGLIPSQELENGLTVDIPLLKYYNYVDYEQEKGRGSLPDIPLHPGLEEVLAPEAFLARVLSIISTKE
ncbi:MAG: S41 family peptidase, partial [Bacteroidota bacterium]